MANALTDPPFLNNPPVKFNANAKIVGLVVGIIAAILAIIDLFGLIGALGFTALCASCGFPFLWLLGALLSLAADILAAIGGFQMYQMNRNGKRLVAYGLALAVLAQIIVLVGTFLAYSGYVFGVGIASIIGFIIWLIIRFCVYYLVMISRFPGEAPLVASAGGYGGYGGGGYSGGAPGGGGYTGGTPGGTPPPPPPGPSA